MPHETVGPYVVTFQSGNQVRTVNVASVHLANQMSLGWIDGDDPTVDPPAYIFPRLDLIIIWRVDAPLSILKTGQ